MKAIIHVTKRHQILQYINYKYAKKPNFQNKDQQEQLNNKIHIQNNQKNKTKYQLHQQVKINSQKDISQTIKNSSFIINNSKKDLKLSKFTLLYQQYKKIYKIGQPQFRKYLLATIITIIHTSTLVYLSTMFSDIEVLMNLNLQSTPLRQIQLSYLLTTCKWSIILGGLGFLTYCRRYLFINISNCLSVRLRSIAYREILQGNYYQQNFNPQTYLHHLITDFKAVSEFMGETLFASLRGIFLVVCGVTSLAYTSPLLGMIAVVVISIFNQILKSKNHHLKLLKQSQNQALVGISQFCGQRFHNMRLIKISNTQKFEEYKFMQQLYKFYQKSKLVSSATGINYAIIEGLGIYSLFLIAVSGALMMSTNLTTFSILASSSYALFAALGFRSIIFFNTELVKVMAIYENLEKKINSIHQLPEYKNLGRVQSLNNYQDKLQQLYFQKYKFQEKGISIIIKDINFNYDNDNKIYHNFNLQIPSGSFIALKGASGSGKSTLLNLLTKLIQPNSGQIYLNDQLLSQLTFKDIQFMISYVTQQNFLFKGTFADNLKYGNHGFDCSNANLQYCLQLSNSYDFVMSRGGLLSEVEIKGMNLSGGEKQRIVLARALVKHPRLLLLDEGTSGIDTSSENIIIENLKNIRSNMTTILITHKLQPFEKIITDIVYL